MKVKTKKKKVATDTTGNNGHKPNVVYTITEIEYTLGCCYRLLREMGHQPMVVAAMLNCL